MCPFPWNWCLKPFTGFMRPLKICPFLPSPGSALNIPPLQTVLQTELPALFQEVLGAGSQDLSFASSEPLYTCAQTWITLALPVFFFLFRSKYCILSWCPIHSFDHWTSDKFMFTGLLLTVCPIPGCIETGVLLSGPTHPTLLSPAGSFSLKGFSRLDPWTC